MVQQAIGAIENALLDIKAKALGVPVYELFGGPVRERILYWSHCGTYRLSWSEPMPIPPLRTLDDVVAAGKEVVANGYTALKTNVFVLEDRPRTPGFARGDYFPELNAERNVIGAIRDQLAAFREGAGPDVDILVDLNFNFKTEGFPEDGTRHGTLRSVLGRNRHAQSQGASPHPAGHHHSRRIRRMSLRPARLPAVLRAAGDGRGDHRHAVERGRRDP